AIFAAAWRAKLGRPATWVAVGAVTLNLVNVPLRWPGRLLPSTAPLWQNAETFAMLRPLVTPQYRTVFVPDVPSALNAPFVQKTGSPLGRPNLNDYDALMSERLTDYLSMMSFGIMRSAIPAAGPATPPVPGLRGRLLDVASVRYLVASPSIAVAAGFPEVS